MNTIADNPFEYSDDNKRYHTYNYYLKKRFGKKVFKVPLNVDLGCPNRDGTKGIGGCIYCSAKLSGDFAGDPLDDIKIQYQKVKEKMNKKWSEGYCIPYFQAGSNTYAPVDFLRKMFFQASEFENAVGLSVATRADCIDAEKADMLAEIGEKTYLTVELGLQTIHDITAEKINRCHTFEDFMKGCELLLERGVNVCVHIINGLPGEDHDMMLETAKVLSHLDLHSVKIHLCHVLKGTVLGEMYLRGEYTPMDLEDYVKIVCDQIEVFPKEFKIARITGDGKKNDLLAPLWSLKKFCVINEIDKEMGRRNSFQGIKYK